MDVTQIDWNRVFKRQPRKALFLHIQKTAGTSIVHIAHSYYPDSIISHGDYIGKQVGEFLSIKFVSGHFGYDFAHSLMRDRYSFTFLRDPKKRVLSMYYFLRAQKENHFPMYRFAKEKTIEGFLSAGLSDSMVKQRLWNNQAWQLAYGWANHGEKKVEDLDPERLFYLAYAHLDSFNHVGFTETFERDRDIILKGLRLPRYEGEVFANASNRKPESELSAEALELLDKLTEIDCRLYNAAWKKYGCTPGVKNSSSR